MRERLLTLLSLLALGAGTALAQPNSLANAPFIMATSQAPPPDAQPAAAAPPAGISNNQSWNRHWDAIIWSAGYQGPPRPTPPQEQEPESPANRFWFAADYLVWWTKSGPIPQPLVTTGPTSAATFGGLTEPGTHVVYGELPQNYGTTAGLRLDTGIWLDDGRRFGLEAGYLFLEQRSHEFTVASDARGNPLLALPLTDPATGSEFTEVLTLPGFVAGGVAITTHSHLQGWEINALANLLRGDHLSFDFLVGFRSLKLDEDVEVFTAQTPLVDQFLSFDGARINPPSHLTTFDDFQSQNQFYGLQVGGRLEWTYDKLTISALGKVALGGTQELERVIGNTSLLTPGAATITVPGGIYAVAGNMGRHFQDQFAVVPEARIQVVYRLTNHWDAHFGYSFLYISNVARPGNQISRSVSGNQIPLDPTFGTGTSTTTPFQIHNSDYWAQGLNFGLTLHF